MVYGYGIRSFRIEVVVLRAFPAVAKGQIKDWTTTTIKYTKQRPFRFVRQLPDIGHNLYKVF